MQSLFGEEAGDSYTQGMDAKGNGKTSGEGKNTSNAGEASESVASLIDKANKAFEDGEKALKDGNWKDYGDKMDELSDLLKKLKDK